MTAETSVSALSAVPALVALADIRIVLVETSHSGNIGSVARAMKNMGLNQLVLVNPQQEIDGKAVALAAGASELLQQARIVSSLAEAISDCGLVVGTSARPRTLAWPGLDARECGERTVSEAQRHPVAVVFGRERNGLTNDELQQCHYHLHIPANPEYSALNLAQAVQIVTYEMRMAALSGSHKQVAAAEYPPAAEVERFYQQLEQTLRHVGFILPRHPGQVMQKLRRVFARARPETQEMAILRGILATMTKATTTPTPDEGKE